VRIAAAGLTAQAFVSAPTLEVLPGEFKRIDAVSGQAVAADTVHLTLRRRHRQLCRARLWPLS
jgi:hypothetical protein